LIAIVGSGSGTFNLMHIESGRRGFRGDAHLTISVPGVSPNTVLHHHARFSRDREERWSCASRTGLLLVPDRTSAKQPNARLDLSSLNRGSALDDAPQGIGDAYGRGTAAGGALQLEYPCRGLAAQP
jgi:hypothetical protein